MARSKLEWYAVKGLFRWFFKRSKKTSCVEERIVLFRARNFDDAFSKASKEAKAYCLEDPKANFRIEPMGWWDAFYLFDETAKDSTEVYSRLIETKLSTKSFVKRYYPKTHDREKPNPTLKRTRQKTPRRLASR